MAISMKRFYLLILGLFISQLLTSQIILSKKQFTHEDAMKFRSIRSTAISDNGLWVAYSVFPDRGDGNLIVSAGDDTNKVIIPRGDRPVFSNDGYWLAAVQMPKSLDVENAKSPKDKPKNGMILLRNSTGKFDEFENINKFEFSNDSKWLIYQKYKDDNRKSDKMKKKEIGSELIIKHLFSGTEIKIDDVSEYLLDSTSTYLFYTVSSPEGKRDGVYRRDLKEDFAPETAINKMENTFFSALAWNDNKNSLAYISSTLRKDGRPDEGQLILWEKISPQTMKFAVTSTAVKKGWYIPAKNKTQWSEDGLKLFFGLKPNSEKDTADIEDLKFTESSFYDADSILYNSDDLIWHWKDPRISTHQVNWWNKNKDRTYAAVYDAERRNFFQLADETLEDVKYSDNSNFTIGYDDSKYALQSTWGGWFYDLYVIDLNTGERKLVVEAIAETANLSPLGKHIVYFKDKNWHIYDTETGKMSNITERIKIPFHDIDQDLPIEAGSYGIGGFFELDKYVLIYERNDIYKFFLGDHGSFVNLTATVGRRLDITFRLRQTNTRKKVFSEKDTVYMHGYSHKSKNTNLYFLETHIAGGINICTESGMGHIEGKNYFFVKKAQNADKILYTKESFDEFPDLWYSDIFLDSAKKISDVNPEMKDFIWGTTESLSWVSPVGDTLDGYLIKPDGFDPKKKYPVLVYYYERFSEHTHRFYQPRINHRPAYQVYLGEGYLVFVPDVKYRDGRPGTDAVDAVTSGVQTLIDRGIADPKKLVIQGHSWAGYQTAYIVTQTDMFAAAGAGAPVGNMTSAYSQIRTESGLARQFQYEKYQSRIGGNLWDSLDAYIRNSPVFYANKAVTPLLILHGNVDEAVPFSQGVELYLAFRRLSKNCVMVEYRNEPHHPRKYENRLDWAIKMKQWFDHYALGKPAPEWISEGRIYKGNK
ncbi:MAG: S9 family peptidase [Candidatus Kapabacteria bacterium]|nr:S9 family peptidase [Ignavibacteriota bacterium]MCW5884815.1 S9 family peptidase [Candidatus Kapabacteria bacterium]